MMGNEMSRFSVRGSGRSWAVFDHGGAVATFTHSEDAAACLIRLERRARMHDLRAQFTSEGPHNRMCDPCRKQ